MNEILSLLPVFAPVLWVTARCYGLTWTAPLLGSPVVTARMRIGLAVLLGAGAGSGVTAPMRVEPWSISDVLWQLPLEFALGAALGCGARLVLAGLELTAGLIDAQAGWGSSLPHPDGGEATSAGGAWLVVLGGLMWVTLAPGGGDVRILAALLETLRTIPPGAIDGVESMTRLVQDVVLSSLVLGLQVASPVVLTAGLLQAAWVNLARARGGAIWHGGMGPARVAVALLVLAMTSTEAGARVASGVNGVLQGAVAVLSESAEIPP
jgi:flagellar biosynthetic protein FliR